MLPRVRAGVAPGRPFLADPFLADPGLVHRIRTGAPVNAVRATYAMYTGGPTRRTGHPALRTHG
ncbi:hypothetical protein [Streptomyces sp. NPDC059092]|uniref:hypothetical protein n=1 Tax=Streptomyces sp. NPDC059092 TaxID=3346725 RepID=UPI0036971120